MLIEDLLTLPCTIDTRVVSDDEDDFGNKMADSVTVEVLCELQQRARSENTDAGTVATTEWALFLPPTVDIAVGDAVTVGDTTYEVRGEPWRARNPFTGVDEHIEATIVETRGRSKEVGS